MCVQRKSVYFTLWMKYTSKVNFTCFILFLSGYLKSRICSLHDISFEQHFLSGGLNLRALSLVASQSRAVYRTDEPEL